jgi:hypothetical protein
MGAPPVTSEDATATVGWVVKSREDQDRIGDALASVIGLA